MVLVFIGGFAVSVGLVFALRRIRLLNTPFLVNKPGTLRPSSSPERTASRSRSSAASPCLTDRFAAYFLEDTTYVGGFLVLAAVELGHDRHDQATDKSGSPTPTEEGRAVAPGLAELHGG
jgi:hypothetical protein